MSDDIFKNRNRTLRIEKMNLIKAVERKNKKIERLNNNWDKLEKFILDWNDVILISTVKTKMGSGYFEGAYTTIHKILDKMRELKGDDKNDKS